MPTIDKDYTLLSRIRLLGQADGKDALWALRCRAIRVPAAAGDDDYDTPGVFSLRTLVLRSDEQTMMGLPPRRKEYAFVDPALLDYHGAAMQDGTDKAFELDIFGATAKVALESEFRVLVRPGWQHPNFYDDNAEQLAVPAYVLAEGGLMIAGGLLEDVLPSVVPEHCIELRPDGVVYTANIISPDGGEPIATRVRLQQTRKGKVIEASIVLMNPQPAQADAKWRKVWLNMNAIAQTLRDTACARLGFDVGADLPALRWVVTRKRNKLEATWTDMVLQAGIATITLADQPVESQVLGPQQVLSLTPAVTLTRQASQLTISTGPAQLTADVIYSWSVDPKKPHKGTETFDFRGDIPLVHDPKPIRKQLCAIYGQEAAAPEIPVTGFMLLDNGWLEVPVEGKPRPELPEAIGISNSETAQGSLILGNRRQEFYADAQAPAAGPWSLQLDEPVAYSLIITIANPANPSLAAASIRLAGCALEARGLAWMANTGPDAHDALPVASDHPDAYFDLVLRRCQGKADAAPFALSGLKVIAQQKPADGGWNALSGNPLQLALDGGLALRINPAAVASSQTEQTAWLRHPSLPSVQVMAATRSDPASTLPHASRALTPFVRKAGAVVLNGPASMMPRMADTLLDSFKAKGDATNLSEPLVPLVALTLPGKEMLPVSPTVYDVKAEYVLQLFDEPHARAVLPPPEDVDAKAGKPAPPPTITALQPVQLEALMLANKALRKQAATAGSSMFARGAMGSAIGATPDTLVPPLQWAATVQVDPKVTFQGKNITFGTATFKQNATGWKRTLSGDQLLAGPGTTGLRLQGTAVELRDMQSGSNDRLLVGWSVEEETSGGYVWDSRGIGWKQQLDVGGKLMARAIQVRSGTGTVAAGNLLSTREAFTVMGIEDVDWRLAFTDVPVAGNVSMLDSMDPAAPQAAAAMGWAWSLWDAKADAGLKNPKGNVIRPLRLGCCFRFVPSALVSVVLTDVKTLKSVIIAGVLTLGADTPAVASDTLRRVTITMEADAWEQLQITTVTAANLDGFVTWDLDLQAQAYRNWSGVAQLTGSPVLRAGQLKIEQASLGLQIFQGRFDVNLNASITPAPGPLTQVFPDPGDMRAMHVSKLCLDLTKASLLTVELKCWLRTGVAVSITQTRGMDAKAQVQWFGNTLPKWNVSVDEARRSLLLVSNGPPDDNSVTLFPGLADAAMKDGVVGVSVTPADSAGLAIKSLFCELRFVRGSKLTVSHLLQTGGPGPEQDSLRFDGTWIQESLVGWPQLEQPALRPGQNSALVEFATAQRVQHTVDFELSDHCIAGEKFQPAAGSGISLISQTQTAPTWLVEAVHTLDWTGLPNGPHCIRFRAMHTLQLWRAEQLAVSMDDTSKKFGFVPGFMGVGATKDFLRPGVQRIARGYIGLFDTNTLDELKKLSDSWVLLGGQTTLVRHPWTDLTAPPPDHYTLLHLPFIAVMGQDAAIQPLKDLLAPPAGSSRTSKLRMSRHDVVHDAVRTEAPLAISAAELILAPAAHGIPFAQDLVPTALVSGAALARDWLDGSPVYLPGWHVEQIQQPGKTGAKEPLPHRFARAAMMLAVLRKNTEPGTQDSLSVLTRFHHQEDETPVPVDITVKTVRLQSLVEGLAPQLGNPNGDLVIGGEAGVRVLPIGSSDVNHDDPKHLIALTLSQMAEPGFVVRRLAAAQGAFVACELPARHLDPLDFAVRAQRPATIHTTDGHLTWPEAWEDADVGKADLAITAQARAPKHFAAPLYMAAVAGRLGTSRPMGLPFDLQTPDKEVTQTVWLEERDRVVFSGTTDHRADAAPWMQDAAVAARPLVPSTKELARAILALEPGLASDSHKGKTFQTYLPAVTDTLDFSARTGAFVTLGVRGLSSRNAVHHLFEQADGGPAVTRNFRRPRPVALPENTGKPAGWRRTLGWWGKPDQSCLALLGAWDVLAGPPHKNKDSPRDQKLSDQDDLPSWSIYMGKAHPFGMSQEARGAPLAWRGAVVVTCMAWKEVQEDDKIRYETVEKPAEVVLALLTEASGKFVHAGLRAGARWMNFESVQLATASNGQTLSSDRLVFIPGSNGVPITEGDGVFECGFQPPSATLPAGVQKPLDLKPKTTEQTLRPADFRMVVLPVRGPLPDRFALPLVRRTVFFNDPAFDRRLSKVEPLSTNQVFDSDRPDQVFNLWLDRQATTPNETAVLRVITNVPKTWKFMLKARTIHKSDGTSETLRFHLGPTGTPADEIDLTEGDYYALPTSNLRTPSGAALQSGDTLVLELACTLKTPSATPPANAQPVVPARLLVPIKSRTVLPPPQAMYSLVAADTSATPAAGWCSMHSAMPVPEAMTTDVRAGTSPQPILRRGLFKWVAIDRVTAEPLGYSILKAERTTESTHIPDSVEKELRL